MAGRLMRDAKGVMKNGIQLASQSLGGSRSGGEVRELKDKKEEKEKEKVSPVQGRDRSGSIGDPPMSPRGASPRTKASPRGSGSPAMHCRSTSDAAGTLPYMRRQRSRSVDFGAKTWDELDEVVEDEKGEPTSVLGHLRKIRFGSNASEPPGDSALFAADSAEATARSRAFSIAEGNGNASRAESAQTSSGPAAAVQEVPPTPICSMNKVGVEGSLTLYPEHIDYMGFHIPLREVASVKRHGNNVRVTLHDDRELSFHMKRGKSEMVRSILEAVSHLPVKPECLDVTLLPGASSTEFSELFKAAALDRPTDPSVFPDARSGSKEVFAYTFSGMELEDVVKMLFSTDSCLLRNALGRDSPPAEHLEITPWSLSDDGAYMSRNQSFTKATLPSATSVSIAEHLRIVSNTQARVHTLATITNPPWISGNLLCHTIVDIIGSDTKVFKMSANFWIEWTSPPSSALQFFGVDKKTLEGAEAYWKQCMKKEIFSALKQARTDDAPELDDGYAFTDTEFAGEAADDSPWAPYVELISNFVQPNKIASLLPRNGILTAAIGGLVLCCVLWWFISWLTSWSDATAWQQVALELASDGRQVALEKRLEHLESTMEELLSNM